MHNTKSAFAYNDILAAQVFIDEEDGGTRRPHPLVYGDEYDTKYVAIVDDIVDRARKGDILARTDALLTTAYFIERYWPLPDSLSIYIAEALQNAVIAFGYTEGRIEKRNSAICAAIGLVAPKGAPLTEKNESKRLIVHSYIWWRMALYKERLYAAARQAMKAFKKVQEEDHDVFEKYYNAVETKRDRTKLPSLRAFIALTIHEKMAFDHYGLKFNDDPFLRDVARFLLYEVEHVDSLANSVKPFLNAIGLADIKPERYHRNNLTKE